MIPIEARIDELEEHLGLVAAWLEYRFPELGQIRLHSAIQDEGVSTQTIAAVLVDANSEGFGPGMAVAEAKRCLGMFGWNVNWFSGSPVAAGVWSDAVPLLARDWVNTMLLLEDGDPVFGPD
ncbi:hypothetical protein [Roseovarius sp. SYSU LYC5161]|uniref:hypothetical protein n=1 Tax=Roseovarius halophilus (ex Wu et al. 2025) TaxID=3376060 RepID=UPI00399B44D4